MSTPTNFNQPSMPPYETSKKSNATTIMGIAIGALVLICGYLFYSKSVASNQLESTTMELTQQTEAYKELEAKFTEAKTQLEQQLGINQELDAKINEQIKQLETQKNEISGLIQSKKEYKSALANLERQKNEYLAQIEQLKAENGILTEKNTQLTSENQTLATNLNDKNVQLDEANNAKAALISEKTNLEAERTALSKKVDVASAVKVKNITTKSVAVKKSGKERSKNRAKNVDKLSICFTTEANEVVPAGEETFYIRIVDPTGAPLAVESLGSGVAMSKREESEFRYTTTATCNYSNGETEVCGAWQPGQDFVKGEYKIQVYNKGYLVGTGAFKLK